MMVLDKAALSEDEDVDVEAVEASPGMVTLLWNVYERHCCDASGTAAEVPQVEDAAAVPLLGGPTENKVVEQVPSLRHP